jgi:uridine phosphorylase
VPLRLPHLGVARGTLPRYAFLCGDPFRVTAIASLWDTATELTFTREFRMTLAALAGRRHADARRGRPADTRPP